METKRSPKLVEVVDPVMTSGQASSRDPFKSQLRLGRIPVMTNQKSTRKWAQVLQEKGPATRTRAKHQGQEDLVASTDDDMPSTVLDDSEGRLAAFPTRKVEEGASTASQGSLHSEGQSQITRSLIEALITQMENIAAKDKSRKQPVPKQSEVEFSRRRNPSLSGDQVKSLVNNEVNEPYVVGSERGPGLPRDEPTRGHPGLYLPRSASIFNPFTNLKFAGVGDKMHPILFLKKFQQIANFEQIDKRSQLHYFEMCLTGSASIWWGTRCIDNVEEAIEAFRHKYWNTSQQLDLNHKLLIGRYGAIGDGSMSEYTARNFQDNSLLDNPLPEREFVAAIVAHFPREVERELRVSLVKTVPHLLEVLDEIEASRTRSQRCASARSGTREEKRSGSRTIEGYQRYNLPFRDQNKYMPRYGQPSIPAKPNQERNVDIPRREPWSRSQGNSQRLVSPPPYPTRKVTTTREDYVKRVMPQRDQGNTSRTRNVNFRSDARVAKTKVPTETISVTERREDEDVSTGRMTSDQRRNDEAEGTPMIAPISTKSSDSSSTEQKSMEEYVIKVPLQRDGKILLPITIVHENHHWSMKALVDTGATISIIAERELDGFSRFLEGNCHMKLPRGGFFPHDPNKKDSYERSFPLQNSLRLLQSESGDTNYVVQPTKSNNLPYGLW